MRKVFCPLFMLSCAAIAWPQAVVETATGTAASSTGTAATGKSISGVFDSLSKKLDKAGKPGGTSASGSKLTETVSSASNQVPKEPTAPTAAKLVDPTLVMIGLDVEELIKRCGEPSMSITQMRDSQSIETYWYYGTHHEVLEVTLRDGKVTSVTPKVTQPHER